MSKNRDRQGAAGKRQEAGAGRGIGASGHRGIDAGGRFAEHRPARGPVGTAQHDTVLGVGHSQCGFTLEKWDGRAWGTMFGVRGKSGAMLSSFSGPDAEAKAKSRMAELVKIFGGAA